MISIQDKTHSGEIAARVAYVPPIDPTGASILPEGPVAPVMLLPSDPKQAGEFVARLNLTGQYQVQVSQPLGFEAQYTLSTNRPAKALAAESRESRLGLGGSDYRFVEGAPGKILRVEASSDQFDTELDFSGRKESLWRRTTTAESLETLG